MKTILYIVTLYSLHQQLCSGQGNPCDTHRRCGAFGICNAVNSPICSCLHGFNPVNQQEWSSGNWTNGCTRRVPLGCQGRGNNGTRNDVKDGFLDLEMIKIPSGYPTFGTESACRDQCLMNCTCMAYSYSYGVSQSCSFWNGNLFDIQRSPSYSEGSHLYVRVASSEVVVAHHKKAYTKIMAVAIMVLIGIIVFISRYLCWKWWTKQRGERSARNNECTSDLVDVSVQEALNRVNLLEFPLYKIKVLVNATNNFSEANKLGKGGFGPVYKGQLPNGREIAVKRLSKVSGQGLQEFMNEVELISKLQHRNLVRLLGCCVEGKEKMLIYEYMPNKSLDVFLFNSSKETLDWKKRFSIIEGICRGLLYLHRDSRLKIIHRDLKPSNILLDNNWNPKISDFGMARIYGTKQDHVSTVKVVGTYGYMAPEYAIEGRFSEKSDVFSFGVLMLEIVSGKRNRTFFHGEDSLINLLGYAWKLWSNNNVAILIDSRISNPNNRVEILRCVQIGLLCVQELPNDRPSVSSVLTMLTSETVEFLEPKPPATSIKSSRSDMGTGSTQQNQKSCSSINNVTITMLDGR